MGIQRTKVPTYFPKAQLILYKWLGPNKFFQEL